LSLPGEFLLPLHLCWPFFCCFCFPSIWPHFRFLLPRFMRYLVLFVVCCRWTCGCRALVFFLV
jgi:hypothetical protein